MAQVATWRPTDDMAAWIQGRAERAMSPLGLGARTRIEMLMWRTVLEAELARQSWSLDELGVIAAAMGGAPAPDAVAHTVGLVAMEVHDAGEAPAGLLERLQQLGPAADIALADAVSRWWAGGHEHSAIGWARVGVRVS